MPGTPATSPRVGAPRYADTDVASFSAQVNSITDAFDAFVAKRLDWQNPSTNFTASDHEVVTAGGATTITLPTPTSEHELVCVYAQENSVSMPDRPVTIQYGGSGGGKIYGKGLAEAGVTSFTLGTPGAFVWLFAYDGTNWRIVYGEADTGYVSMTGLPTGHSINGRTPAARLHGGMVNLQGAYENLGASAWQPGQSLGTLPEEFFPFAGALLSAVAGNPIQIEVVNTGSQVELQIASGSIPYGATIGFDSLHYDMSNG